MKKFKATICIECPTCKRIAYETKSEIYLDPISPDITIGDIGLVEAVYTRRALFTCNHCEKTYKTVEPLYNNLGNPLSDEQDGTAGVLHTSID